MANDTAPTQPTLPTTAPTPDALRARVDMTLAEARKNEISVRNREAETNIVPGFGTVAGFRVLGEMAASFASSGIVPASFGKNPEACMVALDMANRMGMPPLAVMQNLYVVHGSPAWSAKFLIAAVNASGRFSALRYENTGKLPTDKDFGMRAWAIELATKERLNGPWVTSAMVAAEGWETKNGSKWKTLRELMFMYRAGAFWARVYAPEIALGLSTAEEAEDVGAVPMRETAEGVWEPDPTRPAAVQGTSLAAERARVEIATPADPEPAAS